MNQYHFWGEPIRGYYRSDDEWVIRKQMEMLTMAGVDYLYLDVTNKFLYDNVTQVLFRVLQEYYDSGWDVPKVMYYVSTSDKECMQTIQNIRTWKYSEAKHYRYEEISADVNSFADESWKQAATYLDFTGECIERDHLSFDGSFRLEDTSNRNDIAKVSVLHDSEYVYFRVETVDNITAYEEGDSGWMNIFVGTEGSGAEKFLDYGYVINRRGSGNKTGVFKYADGAWKETAEGDIYVQGNVMQVRVKLSDLGMSADNYCMQFKVTDNVKNETDPLSFYTTGDSAPRKLSGRALPHIGINSLF